MQLHLENPIFPKADIRILMTFVAGKNDELGLKADSAFVTDFCYITVSKKGGYHVQKIHSR